MKDWSVPQKVSDVMLAFPADIIGELIPEWDDLPVEFRERRSGYEELARYAFLNAVSFKEEILKDGVDREMADRQINAIARSFQPKHEHKEAAMAYLLSLWLKNE